MASLEAVLRIQLLYFRFFSRPTRRESYAAAKCKRQEVGRPPGVWTTAWVAHP